MPTYSYVAIDADKKTVSGKTELPDRASVIAALQKQNLRPVSINEVKAGGFSMNITLFEKNKVKQDQLVIFTRQLSAMTGAGVPFSVR